MLKLPWQVIAEVRRGALSRARMADVADGRTRPDIRSGVPPPLGRICRLIPTGSACAARAAQQPSCRIDYFLVRRPPQLASLNGSLFGSKRDLKIAASSGSAKQ